MKLRVREKLLPSLSKPRTLAVVLLRLNILAVRIHESTLKLSMRGQIKFDWTDGRNLHMFTLFTHGDGAFAVHPSRVAQ